MMTERENYLRTLEFRHPERIPCSVNLSPATWQGHRESLEEIVLRHPLLFPDFEAGTKDFDSFPPVYAKGYYRDNWGCVWHTVEAGLEGQVVQHPLADWSALEDYRPPDMLTKTERGERDWAETRRAVEEEKKNGRPALGHGERLFDRLYALRGFENLMVDIATDDPHLPKLIDMLLEYEMSLIETWLDIGIDAIWFHTDIGTQRGLMISPAKFRKYLKPMFTEMFTTCRKAGTHVLLSSDGRLLEIVDDLIECGVSMHDPQLRANTLAGIAEAYKGRICINLDLDRQMFAFCTPVDIRRQVREVVDTLGSPEGGLMIFGAVSGTNVPLENIEALCDALEELMRPAAKPET